MIRQEEKGFVTFFALHGGVPHDHVGVGGSVWCEERHIDRSYFCGWTHVGERRVECKDSGRKDAQNNTIYSTPDGVEFVEKYRSNGAAWDCSELVTPMETPWPGF